MLYLPHPKQDERGQGSLGWGSWCPQSSLLRCGESMQQVIGFTKHFLLWGIQSLLYRVFEVVAPCAHRRGGLLSVPSACTTIMQSRACSMVAPTVCNDLLPLVLSLLPRTLSDTFCNQLKKLFCFTVLELGHLWVVSLRRCYLEPWMN